MHGTTLRTINSKTSLILESTLCFYSMCNL